MNILFRVDSSNIIGTGHMYRCLHFAELYSKNNTISFICKKHLFNLNDKTNEKYTCYELELENMNSINLNIDTWLGESQMDDVNKTISVIKDNNLTIDWLIIDHYAINDIWEKEIRKYVKNICVIDDYTNRKHDCDILINQQITNDEVMKYKNIINDDCKVFCGNDYLLLNPLYYNLNISKNINNLKRINIFMGGADIHNTTNAIINICHKFNQDNNLNIVFDVIIGKANKNYESIKQKIQKLDNFTIYYNLPFIGELFLKADLAIGAPGTTSYERCLTQTPSLIICLADNQKTVIQKFIDSETSIYCGSINVCDIDNYVDNCDDNYENNLLTQLNYLNNNNEILKRMSLNCKKFVNIKKNKINTIL